MPIPQKLLSDFKYNLHQLKSGESAILKWPDIAAYADVFLADNLDAGVDPEVVMKYIILCYTPTSPMVHQHPHIGKRKTQVMKLLDLDCDENGHYGEYNNVLLLRGDGIRNRVVTFLNIQHHLDYTIYVHAAEELDEILRLRVPSDAEDAMKRRKLIEETRRQMEDALDRITLHDKSKALEDSIQYFTAQRVLPIRVEQRISKLGESVSPEFAKKGKTMLTE